MGRGGVVVGNKRTDKRPQILFFFLLRAYTNSDVFSFEPLFDNNSMCITFIVPAYKEVIRRSKGNHPFNRAPCFGFWL